MHYDANGASTKSNELGMRVMQDRAYQHRGEQYLLIKSPPASGKSRALMFIALDKMHNQGIKKTIIAVPERTIGASFNSTNLTEHGFYWDFTVPEQWNLCNTAGTESGRKVKAVQNFLQSADKILICTHATFRFALAEYGIEMFDNCLIAIDEFHHVSDDRDNNKLGEHINDLIHRNKTHMVAMTGSYFRGDAIPILSPETEQKFATISYTYYEQLNGYEHLKTLHIGYYFYNGAYVDSIMEVLNPNEKTIVHIPNVNSRESTQDKYKEVEQILDKLGEILPPDPVTGFDMVKTADGKILRIANLVDDSKNREKVATALKNPDQNNNKDFVDIIIALGMAKEGFDWIWCEHALTIGYRYSLTEVVQIIGRATRDAVGKSSTKFTNLIAEPDASEQTVSHAVNNTLKAISASLLMETVLAPKMNFRAKKPDNTETPGYDYGKNGYDPNKNNVGYNPETGQLDIEIKGLQQPKSPQAQKICNDHLTEIVTELVQNEQVRKHGAFDENLIPEEITLIETTKIIESKYPELDKHDTEAVRQQAVAMINLTRTAHKQVYENNTLHEPPQEISGYPETTPATAPNEQPQLLNTALVDGIRQYAMDVRDLKIDLIDSINPFGDAYNIMAKALNEDTLKQIADQIAHSKQHIDITDARMLTQRAIDFKKHNGRLPDIKSTDPWERRMAQGVAALTKYEKQAQRKQANTEQGDTQGDTNDSNR